jgi:hypothetical protein
MAIINQSPAGQASRTLSGITFSSIVSTGSPDRVSRKFVNSASAALALGSGLPSIPVSGQIWPLGLI